MDKPAKNKGSWAGGIAVATLLPLVSAAAIAVMAHNNSQRYHNCITQSDVTSDQCSLLYPAQR